MKTIQEMLQELSQCIVTVSGEFRFRTNWSGGKVPQPDLDVFDPNVPFCIENVGDVPVEVGLYDYVYDTVPFIKPIRIDCKISYNLKSWQDYNIAGTRLETTIPDVNKITLKNNGDRVYIKADFKLPKYSNSYTRVIVLNQSKDTKIRARGNIISLNKGTNDAYKTDYLKIINEYYCFNKLFYECTSLIQAPDLPATTLTYGCYRDMFNNCTSLTQAPELPATTLANNCYSHMFLSCTSLTQAPVLPATTLTDSCYSNMFQGCRSLTQAPELPATTLTYYCYNQMFQFCASLAQAPELPATTLAEACYKSMFYNCKSLTQAPELPATTLANYCYNSMFDGCTKLNQVKCLATDTSATGCTTGWLNNVSATGTFECDNKKHFTLDSPNGIPAGWTITEINPEVEKPDLDTFDPNVPFCIENVGDVKASVQYNTKNTNIRISKDYKTWSDYTTGGSITLDPTDRVYIKSDYVKDTGSNPRFVFNGNGARLRARGNIASLIYGTDDTYVNRYTSTEANCYSYMFNGCTSLTQAPVLPATTLAYNCYSYMFYGCISLTQAPALPATTLATFCYAAMFEGCTSLTQAPELPATTLVTNCYQIMFSGCTSLTQAPVLPAATLADSCYFDMFSDCTSLTQAPILPATTLADRCYYYMFMGCTSLTQAPELPATTLTNECYRSMFNGCTKLNYVKCLATDTSATECTTSWLSNVSSTGTFECDNKKYFTLDSISGIPTGWSITEINPDPPTPPEPEKPDLDVFDPNVPFCIENVGDVPVEVGLYNTGKSAVRSNCKISTNLKTWSDYNLVFTDDGASNDIGRILLQNKGDRVYIKADIAPIGEYPPYPTSHTRFEVFNPSESKKIRARGNIASLNKGTDDTYKTDYLILSGIGNYCYYNLFKDCTSLTQAPELPATTLATSCYNAMFSDCTSLTQAPELPAMTLARKCYQYMFTRCTALINAPKLPATEMQGDCYSNMFYACRSLTHAPDLPAIIVKSYSYESMFQYCTSLTQAPELPATTLATSCYVNMFNGCTSLTQAPELPATKLANYCYRWIFQGCTKLNYVKCLATDTSATDCTTGWLDNVSSTGDFYTPAATNWTTGANGIPTGWTRHDIT